MKTFKVFIAAAACALFLAQSADATFLNRRHKVGANDHYDWGNLGPASTVVGNPTTVSTDMLGIGMTVSKQAAGSLERRDQGNGWAGNFLPGHELIWTQNEPGYLALSFAQPAKAVGAQIQRDLFGTFTATIRAYDTSNVLLASYSATGNSSSAGDNSAIFMGAKFSGYRIARVEFEVDGGAEDFAINIPYMRFRSSVVPEPASMIALGTGLVGLIAARRRRRA